jgi:hypothetical protein
VSETPHAEAASESTEQSEAAPELVEPASDVEAIRKAVPTTSDPRVDDALSRLVEVDTLPLTEQVEVYIDIHRRLAGVLADPDSQA